MHIRLHVLPIQVDLTLTVRQLFVWGLLRICLLVLPHIRGLLVLTYPSFLSCLAVAITATSDHLNRCSSLLLLLLLLVSTSSHAHAALPHYITYRHSYWELVLTAVKVSAVVHLLLLATLALS